MPGNNEYAAKEEVEFRARVSDTHDVNARLAIIGEEIAVQLMWIRAALADIDSTVAAGN